MAWGAPAWKLVLLELLWGLSCGSLWGTTSPLIPRLKEDGMLGAEAHFDEGLFVLSGYLGFISMPFVASITDVSGRRFAIMLGCILVIATSVLCTMVHWMWTLVVLRLLLTCFSSLGVFAGIQYLGEMSDADHRGKLLAPLELFFNLGVNAALVMNETIPDRTVGAWRAIVAMPILPNCAMLALIYTMPESQVMEEIRGQTEQTTEKDGLLGGKDGGGGGGAGNFVGTLRIILKDRVYRTALLAAVLVYLFEFVFKNPVKVYLYEIAAHLPSGVVESTPLDGLALQGTDTVSVSKVILLLSVIELLGNGIGILLVDRFSRKVFMVWGQLLTAVCVAVCGILLTTGASLEVKGVFLVCSFFFVAIGPSTAVEAQGAELFPVQVRATGSATMRVIYGAFHLMIVFLLPMVTENSASGLGLFLVAAAVAMATAALVLKKILPETKGIDLDNIEEVWKAHLGASAE